MPYREGKEVEVCERCRVRSGTAWQRRARMTSNLFLLLLGVLPVAASVGVAVAQMAVQHPGYGASAITFAVTYGVGLLVLTIEFWKSQED